MRNGVPEGIARDIGTTHFPLRDATERIRHVLLRDLLGVFQRLALCEFSQHAACRDGRRAPEGLEGDVRDGIVLHFNVNVNNIGVFPARCLSHRVGLRYLANVAGIAEVLHYLIIIHLMPLTKSTVMVNSTGYPNTSQDLEAPQLGQNFAISSNGAPQ